METTQQTHFFEPRDEQRYPVRRGDKLEVGKIFRSRNGDRVKIYSIEKKAIHGAIFINNVWEIDEWNTDGTYSSTSHPKDIVLNPPLTLHTKSQYKSRDGRPIQIYAINLSSPDFPIIGAIKDENNHWLPRVWNSQGITKRPYGPNNDVVAEWSET